MKSIVLFGAGKSATCLIDYLIVQAGANDWMITVVDSNRELIKSKIGESERAVALTISVESESERQKAMADADIVISLLPPALHYLIAKDCIQFRKNLLTASYVDANLRALEPEIVSAGLLFLAEMGLDPGIDHMSAMQLIDKIQENGGSIESFRSHTGGLIAPESDNNPWHYKISWNPANVVTAGSAGAIFRENNERVEVPYESLFSNCSEVEVPEAGRFAFYPNRDSLSYIPIYGLQHTHTFIRTTLRHPDFCKAWQLIVAAGLTKANLLSPSIRLFSEWSAPLRKLALDGQLERLEYLGVFDPVPIPDTARTSSAVLQYLLETRLKMEPGDKDMIVMMHELEYVINKQKFQVESSLVVKGTDNIRTAMAQTVGLPLGIAARLILEGKIRLRGLHIPILHEIYEPVLKELREHGIQFNETIS